MIEIKRRGERHDLLPFGLMNPLLKECNLID
jgi:hypothetical protein